MSEEAKYIQDILKIYSVTITNIQAEKLVILFRDTYRGKEPHYGQYLFNRCMQVYDILHGKSKSSYNATVLEILGEADSNDTNT
jgi:hypothetical protein